MIHIYHFGTFDVANYGDLLFPLVIEYRLENAEYQFHHCSPVAQEMDFFVDRKPTISSFNILVNCLESPPTAVVVGGGQIIRDSVAFVDDYEGCKILAYPSLWLGAAELATRSNAPLIVNAPGVEERRSSFLKRHWKWFGEQAAYLAIRDQAGVDRFNNLLGKLKSELIYDTAFDVSYLWSHKDLTEVFLETVSRLELEVPPRTIAVHLKPGIDYDEVAESISKLAADTDTVPILLAIGPCHGDSQTQKEVGCRLSVPCIVIDQPKSIKQIAAVIANSELFVGQSMHGYITAFSFGVPAFLCFPKSYSKCAQLVQRLGLEETLDDDWATLSNRVERLRPLVMSRIIEMQPQIRSELDKHWSHVQAIIENPQKDERMHSKNLFWRLHLKLHSFVRLGAKAIRRTMIQISRARS